MTYIKIVQAAAEAAQTGYTQALEDEMNRKLVSLDYPPVFATMVRACRLLDETQGQ